MEFVRPLVDEVHGYAVERHKAARLGGESGVDVFDFQRGGYDPANRGERGVLRGEALRLRFGGGVLGVEARVDDGGRYLRRHLPHQVEMMRVVRLRRKRAQVENAQDLILEDNRRGDYGLQPGANHVGEPAAQRLDVPLKDGGVLLFDAVSDHRAVHRDDAAALAPRRGDAQHVVVRERARIGVVHADGDAVEGDEAARFGGEPLINVVYVERG